MRRTPTTLVLFSVDARMKCRTAHYAVAYKNWEWSAGNNQNTLHLIAPKKQVYFLNDIRSENCIVTPIVELVQPTV